jgi:DNA polymerase elongation subunit (family B)
LTSNYFYTSVHRRGNTLFVRGYRDGKRYQEKVNYKPYLFIQSKDTDKALFRSCISGEPVAKKRFENMKEARDFIERYKETHGLKIFGYDKFEYVYIYDEFGSDVQFDPELIRIASVDIEVGFNLDENGEPIGGFPDPMKAENPITAITLSMNGQRYTFGCGDFQPSAKNVRYFKCADEYALISSFLEIYKSLDPDVLTGWNIEGFDVLYLVNRINQILGEGQAARLSPWGMLETRQIEIRGKTVQFYFPIGVAILDYMQLYKRFSYKNQESYALGFIAQVELKREKLDYSEYGDLHTLYLRNFQKYCEYNVLDTELVDELEDKMKFIQQVFSMAYSAGMNYGDALASVRPWEIICHNFLMDRRQVVPVKNPSNVRDEYDGGYVKEPQIGMHKWVVSFDLNSLYPSIIRQYNVSPECLMGKVDLGMSIDKMLVGGLDEFKPMMLENDVSMCVNGTFYSRAKQGFMSELCEKMYNERVEYKSKMIAAKREKEKLKDDPVREKELTKLIAQFNNQQMVRKIFLNSLYGAMANRYFMFYDVAMAEAITLTGQLTIRWIADNINAYLNKLLKTKDVDYVVASDTDSIYVTLAALVEQAKKGADLDEVLEFLIKVCDKGPIQDFINETYAKLADTVNARENVMAMKLEKVSDKAIWRGKKMYILNVRWDEGVTLNEPEIKASGIESVRSSTPKVCREKIKAALKVIMQGEQDELHSFVADFRTEFLGLDWESIAFPRGVNEMNKWEDKSTIYKSGTPIHVKGALIYNNLIKKKKLETKYPFIFEGDKVKFAYLRQPNPYNITVITSLDVLPKEFNLDSFVDRDKQFEKTFLSPIESITNVIGWTTEKRASLEDWFN